MKSLRIGVIGGGVVGSAITRSYLEHVAEVMVWDVKPERGTHRFDQVIMCDLVFICLPTPQLKDGMGADLSALHELFDEIEDARYNLVLKSTVPIGTTRLLAEKYGLPNLVHSPEFLTARCAFVDAQMPSRNIVGYPGWNFKGGLPAETYVTESESFKDECLGKLISLYLARFPSVPINVMKSDESEAVKLFANGFFGVKLAYWNECRTLADELGLDWETVMNGVLGDGRIHPSHTNVPGPDGKRGFGGACLPKDLASLIDCIQAHKLQPAVTLAAYARNIHHDRKEQK